MPAYLSQLHSWDFHTFDTYFCVKSMDTFAVPFDFSQSRMELQMCSLNMTQERRDMHVVSWAPRGSLLLPALQHQCYVKPITFVLNCKHFLINKCINFSAIFHWMDGPEKNVLVKCRSVLKCDFKGDLKNVRRSKYQSWKFCTIILENQLNGYKSSITFDKTPLVRIMDFSNSSFCNYKAKICIWYFDFLAS